MQCSLWIRVRIGVKHSFVLSVVRNHYSKAITFGFDMMANIIKCHMVHIWPELPAQILVSDFNKIKSKW